MKYKSFTREILKCGLEEGWNKWPSDSKKGVEMPAVQKDHVNKNSKLIKLESPEEFVFEATLQQAIKNRRSRRKYSPGFLSLKELSFLLWSTQGVIDNEIVMHRTVPSASARHPFETYLVVRRVEGLVPAIYRYLPLQHKMCLITDDKLALEQISHCGFEINRSQLQNAAVVFIWAAIPYRTEWRAGPYAYKYIALDAGHVCQNLYLAAEAINCGVCAIAAYEQTMIDKVIKVNGKDEFTVYLATVGKLPL